ncbi:MAG: peptidase MA family metallohydrolase [Bacillota bacterium]
MKKKLLVVIITMVITFAYIFSFNDKAYFLAREQGYKALKVFASVKNSELMEDFLIYETEHFTIKYRERDENIIRNVGRLLEESYDALNKEYSYEPEGKTAVYVYESQQQMWEYQNEVRGQAVMGFYSMGDLHILSPNAYDENKLNFVDFFEKHGPIMHEYMHKLADDITGGNIELWFTEGIALYEEYEKLGIEWAPDFDYEKLFSAEELRKNFMGIEETQAYRQSFDAIDILIKEYGKTKLYETLILLGQGYSLDKAFMAVYGFTADSFLDTQLAALLEADTL